MTRKRELEAMQRYVGWASGRLVQLQSERFMLDTDEERAYIDKMIECTTQSLHRTQIELEDTQLEEQYRKEVKRRKIQKYFNGPTPLRSTEAVGLAGAASRAAREAAGAAASMGAARAPEIHILAPVCAPVPIGSTVVAPGPVAMVEPAKTSKFLPDDEPIHHIRIITIEREILVIDP